MRRLIPIVAASLLVVPAAPAVADTGGTAPFTPVTLPSWTQALQVFTDLEQSVTPSTSRRLQLSIDPVGWAIGAIGVAVSQKAAAEEAAGLAAITSGLQQVQSTVSAISTQIATMQAELEAISEEEAWANCAEQTQVSSQPVAVIQSANDEYLQFTSQASDSDPTAPAPTVDAMVAWAQNYTTQADDLGTAINTIDLMLQGSTMNGSLTACGQALVALSDPGSLNFESNYYGALYQYESYWYQTQVLALNLYVEAQHMLALNAAGELGQFQPTEPEAVCTQDINAAVTAACNNAQGMVNTVYDNIVGQLYQAGAPYLWGNGGQVTATAPSVNDKLWVRDINDFQTESCDLPLSSLQQPCGGAVGTTGPYPQTSWSPATWGQYQGWQPAVTADWLDLFPSSWQVWQVNGNWTTAQVMANAGFGDSSWGSGAGLANLLIYTGEITNSTTDVLDVNYPNTVTGMCLLDTQAAMGGGDGGTMWVRPLCDSAGGGTLAALVSNFNGATGVWSGPGPEGGTGSYWGGGGWTDRTGYYAADFSMGPKDTPWWINQAPGWLSWTLGLIGDPSPQVYQFSPTPEFRWPVLPVSQSMCTQTVPGSSPAAPMQLTTAGGAYTMCGADFAAWLAMQVPPAPTPASVSSVAATPRMGAVTLSWRAPKGQRNVRAYRIRGQRGERAWTTLATVKTSAAAPTSKRMQRSVRIPRRGGWRFKVVTVVRDRKSEPSRPTRRTFVVTKKYPSRHYTFRRGDVKRVVTAYSDGRIRWTSDTVKGVGMRKKDRFVGHTYRGPYRWTGRWQQKVSGSWKNLQWIGWSRTAGPTRH